MSFIPLSRSIIKTHEGRSFTGISVVLFCYDGRGKFLLGKRGSRARDEVGTWAPPAGGLQHHESVEDAVKRELKEEYDATAKQIDFVGYFDAMRRDTDDIPTHWIGLCFGVQVDRQEVKINEPETIVECGWFTLDNIPIPPHSQMGVFLTKFRLQFQGFLDI